MPKKKILIFIDWFLPGYKAGGPVRSMANMVEYLSDTYQFFIVTRNTDYTETVSYKNVDYNCWVEYKKGVQVFYADLQHQNKATYKRLIYENSPEIIYINGMYSWKFSLLPLMVANQFKKSKVVVASRGMLAQSAIDVKGGKKKLFLRFAKLAGLYKNVVFHATNSNEEQDIKKAIGEGVKVSIADNLPKKELITYKESSKKEGELKLVSLARIAPEKNTLYALERLLKLNDIDGVVRFDLYGQIYNEDYWNECQSVIGQLSENIKVEYKGTVDSDLVGETIQQYHALFMPTRGENFGHVILESFMSGRPVVISDQTPWRDLEQERCGWDISLVTEDGRQKIDDKRQTSEWSRVINKLVDMKQDEFDCWCVGARKRAERFINDPELMEGYERLFG